LDSQAYSYGPDNKYFTARTDFSDFSNNSKMEFTIPPRTPVPRVMLDQRDSIEQSGESEGSINIGQQLLMLSAQVMSLQAQFTENNKQSQQQP
jgi:hypothetical protein